MDQAFARSRVLPEVALRFQESEHGVHGAERGQYALDRCDRIEGTAEGLELWMSVLHGVRAVVAADVCAAYGQFGVEGYAGVPEGFDSLIEVLQRRDRRRHKWCRSHGVR